MRTRRRQRQRVRGGSVAMNVAANTNVYEAPASSPQKAYNLSPLCQCPDPNTGNPCRKPVMQGTVFCEEHQNCPMAPRNGCEKPYRPELYNKDPSVYKSHNCYSYAMSVIDKRNIEACKKNGSKNCRQFFHQPGALHGDRFALNAVERRKCGVVEKLIMKDVPEVTPSSFYEKCPINKYKIALVSDDGEDYHFYKQDADGYWSHKDGSNKVKRYDALKQPIFNPQTAARDYRWQGSDLNYESFCGFYCVPGDREVPLGQGGASRKNPKAVRQAKAVGGSWTDRRSVRRRRTTARRMTARHRR